ncbi:DUF3667 domain-containing protein [Pedobacter frigiditerrae]|uniref:DUF3667 domain-containing protein n=1 Tax=Pedobacter frigiditerrae TaxID=2530452 RepID=A0A4R0MN57_9SPHI|nr:DUF3667 domain-containing protein [Pedobacter frigiditerrae]TCC88211.1 DUF3667 domain-containing protein [Pedobacter frigiditerrae]
MNSKHCLNCDTHLVKEQKFCSQCGQPAVVHRFTLSHFFHEAFHAFTHADKGLLYLLKELAIRPGIVAKEYIAGKRKKYYNPFTFFLLLAGFYVLSSTFSASVSADKKPIPEGISRIENPIKKEEAMAMYHRVGVVKNFFTKNSNFVAMIAVPFFALYFWLIYYRKRYNYSEHLVANLMFVSFANLAFSIIVNPIHALFKGTSWEPLMWIWGLLLQLIYFVVAYKGFVELKGLGAMFKIIIATLIGIMLWAFLTQMISAIYVYQNTNFMDYFKHMGGR